MLDKQVNTVHSNGINKDRLFQNKDDVTFALNAIRANHEGGRQEYQSEPGNEFTAALRLGYILLGSIYGQNDEVYLISTNNTLSEIGMYKQGFYTTLANLNLGLSTKFPVTGEYRVKNGCERIIYFGDGNTNDYWFNVDKPDEFKTSGVFDPNKFKFVPTIQVPKMDLIRVNSSGGNLPLGSYYFQLEFVDKDLNSLYKTDVSPQTVVYDDDQSDTYYNIDGGLNAPQYDPAIGGLPSTNKSITLRFYNLDTSFQYLKVNVIRQITGIQTVDAHAVGQLIPISSSDIEWTYVGYNVGSGDYPVDYSSLVINDVKYKSSLVQEQVQGRLVRANVTQDQPDYSEFQQFASVIEAEWVAKEVSALDSFAVGNPKNPKTYWDCTSFQGDEIYAFGIQYLLTNGTWTTVFPLIGRNSFSTDLDLLTVVADAAVLVGNQVWLSDVEHLGLVIGNTVPRWKVFNTAELTLSNTVSHPYNYKGNFGFHESDIAYPDLKDCNGNSIWGEDTDGNIITTGTKIRHFRFPDRRLVPHLTEDGQYIVPLGVKFSNITYPAGVVGHRFTHAVRDESNKTVVDSGWAVQPVTDFPATSISVDANFRDWNGSGGEGYVRYNSANIFYNQKIFNPDYLKLNKVYHIESSQDSISQILNKDGGADIITTYSYVFNPTQFATPTRTNHNIDKQIFIPARTVTSGTVFGIEVDSRDYMADDSIIKLSSYQLENSDLILPGQVIGGANITSPTDQLKYNNFYSYKKEVVDPYTALLNLAYNYLNFNYSITADSNEFYNGDSIISLSSVTRLFWPIFTPDNILQGLCYNTFYEEHEFNTALRYAGTGETNKYYHPGSDIAILIEKVATLQSNETYILKPFDQIAKEYFGLNKDYNVQTTEQGKVSLPLNFDYCSNCENKYPNRIIFSPKSFDEESFDLYRTNKVNDYIDLPAHRGAITGLSYMNNQLLVHTEDTSFVLQPNPQQIATDQNTAYLTTGDFLSIPPQELLQTDIGFGGLQSKQSGTNTPFGRCWVDQKRGEILKWDGKVEVLSNNGLLQWCKENLPSEATKKFYEIERDDFPVKTTTDVRGVGCILYYDPRFKRLLISKKDYLALDQRDEFLTPELTVVWDHSTEVWKSKDVSNATITVVSSNSSLFENKSWTLSYSFPDQSFTSWHTYNPIHAFSDSNNFYTSSFATNSSSIYRHLDKTKYQNYYGSKSDFIVEWSSFDPVTSNVSNLYYVAYSQIWDAVNKQFKTVDTTFDKCMIYNFEQSTGLQTLILQDQHTNPYANLNIPKNSKYVIKTDQNYKIAGLVDMATTQPVVTKDWQAKKLYSGYIDLVPSLTNINMAKSPYDSGNIWDKFTFVRLFYKPVEDHKIAIVLQVLNNQQSIR